MLVRKLAILSMGPLSPQSFPGMHAIVESEIPKICFPLCLCVSVV